MVHQIFLDRSKIITIFFLFVIIYLPFSCISQVLTDYTLAKQNLELFHFTQNKPNRDLPQSANSKKVFSEELLERWEKAFNQYEERKQFLEILGQTRIVLENLAETVDSLNKVNGNLEFEIGGLLYEKRELALKVDSLQNNLVILEKEIHDLKQKNDLDKKKKLFYLILGALALISLGFFLSFIPSKKIRLFSISPPSEKKSDFVDLMGIDEKGNIRLSRFKTSAFDKENIRESITPHICEVGYITTIEAPDRNSKTFEVGGEKYFRQGSLEKYSAALEYLGFTNFLQVSGSYIVNMEKLDQGPISEGSKRNTYIWVAGEKIKVGGGSQYLINLEAWLKSKNRN